MYGNKYIGQESDKGTSTHTIIALSLAGKRRSIRDLEQHQRDGGDRCGQAGASLDSRAGEELRGVGIDAEQGVRPEGGDGSASEVATWGQCTSLPRCTIQTLQGLPS